MARKNPFKASKEVKKEKDNYNKLVKKAKSISSSMSSGVDSLNSLAKNIVPENFSIDKLPVENLHDSYKLESSKGINILGVFKKKREIARNMDKNRDALVKLQTEIQLSEIDILLAKIKYLQDSLGSDGQEETVETK